MLLEAVGVAARQIGRLLGDADRPFVAVLDADKESIGGNNAAKEVNKAGLVGQAALGGVTIPWVAK